MNWKQIVTASWLLCVGSVALADAITLDDSEVFGEKRRGAVPYMFSTDALGAGLGAATFVEAAVELTWKYSQRRLMLS